MDTIPDYRYVYNRAKRPGPQDQSGAPFAGDLYRMDKDTILVHDFRHCNLKGGLLDTNYKFFTAENPGTDFKDILPYWGGDDHIYYYKAARPLVLLRLGDVPCVHSKLQEYYNNVDELLPYNTNDPSFPYEDDKMYFNKTYAWDYLDIGLISSIYANLGLDGVFRTDEVILFSDRVGINLPRVQLVQHRASPDPLPDCDSEDDIYYYPTAQQAGLVSILPEFKNMETRLRAMHRL